VHARIALLPGDGIGPEVVNAAAGVLQVVARLYGHTFEMRTYPIGAAALRAGLDPLPADTASACLNADAVLLGAVGDPAFDEVPRERKPETGLLTLRRVLGDYANLRPARVWPGLEDSGPLKPDRARALDLLIVRELTGGLYFGEPRELDREAGTAVNTLRYTEAEVRRVAACAFAEAGRRRGLVTSVDKANVLETSVLWRSVVDQVATSWPGVRVEHMYVDACAMFLAGDPGRFDVILTENLFGDILSDEAGALVGSLGLLPSASLGGVGLYEPVHGSAPSLAGTDRANPIGAIASAAMLLRHSLDLPAEAAAVESAIGAALAAGARTVDLAGAGAPLSCSGMAREIGDRLEVAVASARR
jgi:3-isopropylmalate dehydrogenase